MTKLVTSVACLQLMERGVVGVDDAKLIEKVLPELAAQPILVGYEGDKAVFKKRTKPLTLHHLLTHTCGSAYSFLGTPLSRWEEETGHKSWTAKGAKLDSITAPLLFEPGTAYQYGHGLDWAGLLVERVSGLTLEDYFRKHIWSVVPGECRSMTFYPTRRAKGRMMGMHGRKDGRVVPDPGWRDVTAWHSMDIKFRFGGAGLIGTARDYTAFLQHLLACYQGRQEGVLRPDTARLLFEDAFPTGGNTCRKDLGRMMSDMGFSPPGWHTGAEVTHSLAMCVNTADSPHGRLAGSAAWGGAARTQQWIDPKTGIVVRSRRGRADSRRFSAHSFSSWTGGRSGARSTRSSARCMARSRWARSCSCLYVRVCLCVECTRFLYSSDCRRLTRLAHFYSWCSSFHLRRGGGHYGCYTRSSANPTRAGFHWKTE